MSSHRLVACCVEDQVRVGGEVAGQRLDGVPVVAGVAAVREEPAVFRVGEEQQPEQDQQGPVVGLGQICVGVRAHPRGDCKGKSGHHVLVDALPQPLTKTDGEVLAGGEDLPGRAARVER